MTDDTVVYGSQRPTPRAYPVSFDVKGPAEVSRLSSFFRIILLIPVALFVGIIGSVGAGGLLGGLLLAHWITILIRGRPVGWICRATVAIQRFTLRAYTYFFLITDKYPPFEGDSNVHYEVDQTERIQRKQLVIWKTLASIPHVIVLGVLWFAVVVCIVISWFAILFTGRFPLGLRGFVVGWMRWVARVGAYWMSLRDEYPPFSLAAEAGPASTTTHVWSGIGGLLLSGGAIGGIVAIVIASANLEEAQASYAGLLVGEPSPTLEIQDMRVTLLEADDRYELADGLFIPEDGDRFVAFTAEIINVRTYGQVVEDNDFRLKDSVGGGHDPVIVSYLGRVGPVELLGGSFMFVRVIFEIPLAEDPVRFEFEPTELQRARFEFSE
ncbi:MAG: hypothetical protein DRI30_07615 [Chloroflexi bacterium]|nr:MAG: hypothetical protein DRI30_07615 [Chloroflexota bacterium]